MQDPSVGFVDRVITVPVIDEPACVSDQLMTATPCESVPVPVHAPESVCVGAGVSTTGAVGVGAGAAGEPQATVRTSVACEPRTKNLELGTRNFTTEELTTNGAARTRYSQSPLA